VIRPGAVGYVLGQFLLILAGCMVIPLSCALFGKTSDPHPLLYPVWITAAAGLALWRLCPRPSTDLSAREGLLLTCATWLAASFFGGLPFYFSPHYPTLADAFFEAASGFTTTGATVLAQVEVLSPALQFWRCFTHWLGGMGIVLLGLAVLPLLGVGGAHLYRAEFSGAKSEKLKPRITETALSLWRIYFALTLAEYLALRWAGLNSFDAACHAFSTIGTGGFSSRTASIAGFASPAIEYIIVGFMLLAGMNFARHYQLWIERRPRAFFSDPEIRWYVFFAALGTGAIAVSLILHNRYAPGRAVRAALFQVSSIMTTTGFVTDDFERWSSFTQLLLLALMFVGGCTGSSAGGLKVSRIVVLLQVVLREFRRMVERRGVFAVRFGGQVIPETTIQSLLNLVYLSFLVNFVSCLLLASVGVDVLTSISAVAAAMFNIGPGLGAVGPAEHYGHLPALAKWVLSGCMLAGRLEFYTALVVFTPSFWRK
jgi:trk system potassium uptake protein TrkH